MVEKGGAFVLVPQEATNNEAARSSRKRFMAGSSLYILHLFADLFEFRFRFHDGLGDGGIIGF